MAPRKHHDIDVTVTRLQHDSGQEPRLACDEEVFLAATTSAPLRIALLLFTDQIQCQHRADHCLALLCVEVFRQAQGIG